MNKKIYVAPAITIREISTKVSILAGSGDFGTTRRMRINRDASMFDDDEDGYAD